ncbi:MAG: CoA transferase, partial [Myxococcota bacterium]
MHGLAGLCVLDLTSGIAGAYATKLFIDAGADVVKVGGLPRPASALFRFLTAGKRIALRAGDALLDAADLIVSDDPRFAATPRPQQVVLSITPYGCS